MRRRFVHSLITHVAYALMLIGGLLAGAGLGT